MWLLEIYRKKKEIVYVSDVTNLHTFVCVCVNICISLALALAFSLLAVYDCVFV